MSFGEILDDCIKISKLSMNAISNKLDLNRGYIYGVTKGTRKMTSENLFDVIKYMSLPKENEKLLVESFFSEYYGESQYNKLSLLIEKIQTFDSTTECKSVNTSKFERKVNLNGSDKIMAAVDYIINSENNCKIVSNYPFSMTQLNDLFYYRVYNKTIEGFDHIVSMTGANETSEIEIVFNCLRFLFLQCFPYYTYSKFFNDEFSVYPYFVIGDEYAVLFNEKDGIFIDDSDIISNIRNKAQAMIDKCKQFGQPEANIFKMKDFYAQVNASNTEMSIFCSHPCITVYQDLEMFYSIAKDEIEHRDMLVHMAHEHYNSLSQNTKTTDFLTLSGLNEFVEYGNVAEMPKELKRPLPKEQIIKCLKKIRQAIENNELYILDASKFIMPSRLIIECSNSKVMFFGHNDDEHDFIDHDIFFAELDSRSLIEVVKTLQDYLIHSHCVYEKQVALSFINNRIVSLENDK